MIVRACHRCVAVAGGGGAIFAGSGFRLAAQGCRFASNHAGGSLGGAVVSLGRYQPLITDCDFFNNTGASCSNAIDGFCLCVSAFRCSSSYFC